MSKSRKSTAIHEKKDDYNNPGRTDMDDSENEQENESINSSSSSSKSQEDEDVEMQDCSETSGSESSSSDNEFAESRTTLKQLGTNLSFKEKLDLIESKTISKNQLGTNASKLECLYWSDKAEQWFYYNPGKNNIIANLNNRLIRGQNRSGKEKEFPSSVALAKQHQLTFAGVNYCQYVFLVGNKTFNKYEFIKDFLGFKNTSDEMIDIETSNRKNFNKKFGSKADECVEKACKKLKSGNDDDDIPLILSINISPSYNSSNSANSAKITKSPYEPPITRNKRKVSEIEQKDEKIDHNDKTSVVKKIKKEATSTATTYDNLRFFPSQNNLDTDEKSLFHSSKIDFNQENREYKHHLITMINCLVETAWYVNIHGKLARECFHPSSAKILRDILTEFQKIVFTSNKTTHLSPSKLKFSVDDNSLIMNTVNPRSFNLLHDLTAELRRTLDAFEKNPGHKLKLSIR